MPPSPTGAGRTSGIKHICILSSVLDIIHPRVKICSMRGEDHYQDPSLSMRQTIESRLPSIMNVIQETGCYHLSLPDYYLFSGTRHGCKLRESARQGILISDKQYSIRALKNCILILLDFILKCLRTPSIQTTPNNLTGNQGRDLVVGS